MPLELMLRVTRVTGTGSAGRRRGSGVEAAKARRADCGDALARLRWHVWERERNDEALVSLSAQ